MEYTVTWKIELDADSHQEAAEIALDCLRDENSWSCVFNVWDTDGVETVVDLNIGT